MEFVLSLLEMYFDDWQEKRSFEHKRVAHFSPLQVGVAVPCGAEAVVHGWKIIMDMFGDDPDIVAVKVDFDNAFNNANRAEMLRLCNPLQGYDIPEVVKSR